MTSEVAVANRARGPLMARAKNFVFGPPLPARLPERVESAIGEEQASSEILVSLLQLLAVATFAILYTLTPRRSRRPCRSSRCRSRWRSGARSR